MSYMNLTAPFDFSPSLLVKRASAILELCFKSLELGMRTPRLGKTRDEFQK